MEVKKPNQDGWSIATAKAKQGNAHLKVAAGEVADCHICVEYIRVPTKTLSYCSKCHNGFCPMHGNYSHHTALCFECGYSQTKASEILANKFGLSSVIVLETMRKLKAEAKKQLKESPNES